MKGVREEPYFDIPVANFIWPLLHTLIGIGNNILTYLINYADNEIQHVPVRQILVREEIKELDKKIGEYRDTRNYFDSSNENSGKELLKGLRKEEKAIDTKMNSFDGDEEEQEHHVLNIRVWELECQISELEIGEIASIR